MNSATSEWIPPNGSGCGTLRGVISRCSLLKPEGISILRKSFGIVRELTWECRLYK
jgi:hypothetical protein